MRDRGCEAPLALQLVVVLLLSPLCHCVVGPTCAVAFLEGVEVQLLLFESFGGFGKGVREILRRAADVLQNKLTRAQYLDEVTWTTKNWLGLQKQRISVVLHTAIAEQVVNELACGGGGRVHGAKCLATLAGVA